ncbi:glycosyltransferase family 9 protein [Granulicella mallensis]|uniref:Lipopolysaccharide heptosyltransferase I n=1 Tax=Granulicella mallensis (strain ATCC BAA-1857 / DSM 23137 / MP5ACTX8) TaxID=682795 RepID=G8NPE7_GRAMM|nr:glycosyltransferase family 9 protein [Granulicella mallensis]AEU34867.1 lipopolysaccharide heptosyltransferase I [Granulicella mallensis MP5ACTX8]
MRVLIVRVGALGDVLHALPAVAALRKQQPEWLEWTIDWVVDPRWAPLLVGDDIRGPVVDRIHAAETKLWSSAPISLATLRSVLDLRSVLRAERYDLVIDMQGTVRSAVIGRMAGARKFAGYSDPREAVAVNLYTERLARRGAHVVEQGAALLGEACGLKIVPVEISLPRVAWAEHWAEEEAVLSRPLCVLGAGGGWGAKHWPTARFGALALELRAMGFDVVVNAPHKNDVVANEVVAASRGTARMVVCNVTGLVALMRRTDLFIGGDSGPTHLAAALGVPLVALFGPTDPARNGPWGPGAKRVLRDASSITSYKHVAEGDPGLARITVESVLEAVRQVRGT